MIHKFEQYYLEFVMSLACMKCHFSYISLLYESDGILRRNPALEKKI